MRNSPCWMRSRYAPLVSVDVAAITWPSRVAVIETPGKAAPELVTRPVMVQPGRDACPDRARSTPPPRNTPLVSAMMTLVCAFIALFGP